VGANIEAIHHGRDLKYSRNRMKMSGRPGRSTHESIVVTTEYVVGSIIIVNLLLMK
jgi:hypothetical protein